MGWVFRARGSRSFGPRVFGRRLFRWNWSQSSPLGSR